ncbi:MAG: pyridoxal phosphate-dependent aminotransferase [Thermoplasmata archaeon]|nr:MAG: pyridoxal phosphate-dependent aminotransferase [Thermoplasmata archaeon]
MQFASRLEGIELSGLRKMFELSTKESINLGLGEPDFNPPETALEGLKKAVYDGKNKYGPTAGIPELKAALAEKNQIYKKDLSADNVLVTGSGSEALMTTMLSFVESGDEVLYPDPGFVLYKPQIQLAGGKGVAYPVEQEFGFVPQINQLEELVTDKTKVIIVNSPSNPTGAVFNQDDVKAIIRFAEDHNLLIVSDEVYDKMVYNTQHNSFLGDYENVIYINSFSKIYAMTGWRLGYLIGPKELVQGLMITHYHIMACPPSPFQHAALAAMSGPQDFVEEMVGEFKQRRDLIVEKLNDVKGFSCLKPEGAFYAFPSFDLKMNSVDLAMKLAQNGVICSPGTAFGPRGEGHLRFSYAASRETIERGIDVVADVVKKL